MTFPGSFGLDDIVGRYDDLSASVSERNEKLQMTLTRSLSVQDGLDEMLLWMEGVERCLQEPCQLPLSSTALQDVISKSIVSDFKQVDHYSVGEKQYLRLFKKCGCFHALPISKHFTHPRYTFSSLKFIYPGFSHVQT